MRINRLPLFAWKDYPGINLLGGVLVDQVIKFTVPSQLNSGIAFSLGRFGSPLLLTVGLLAFAVGAFLISWPRVKSDLVLRSCHALFFAGAFSNLIDRALFGGVRDVWTVPFLGIQNNLADWLIVGAASIGIGWYQFRPCRDKIRL